MGLIGVHGGCGVSTCVRLLDPDSDGWVWEVPIGGELAAGRMPVLVTRSTAIGLQATAVMLEWWAKSQLPPPALLLVADVPWRVPSVVRYRLRALSSQLSSVVRVPFLYELRSLDDPVDALRYRRAARAVGRVLTDVDSAARVWVGEYERWQVRRSEEAVVAGQEMAHSPER